MKLNLVLIWVCILMLAREVNAQRTVYLDPLAPVKVRVQDLLGKMTLEEKVAQMCQYVGIEHQIESYKINKGVAPPANDDASTFYRGISFDSLRTMVRKGMVGSFLHVVTASESNTLQRLAMESRLKIPLIIGIDAIHGNAMVEGCTVFPIPLALAGTFDPALVEEISRATAKEMRATGSHWTFTPNVDIARDARWGRTGETFGEDPYLVTQMGSAMVQGLQGGDLRGTEVVLSCLKHLVGGGQSINGLNGAPTDVSERTLWEVHLPPYAAGIRAGAFTVMAAHNELNGVPCHASQFLLTKLLRGKWNFEGFVVSDWMDIERLATIHKIAADQREAVWQTISAGMDMHMHGPGFQEHVVSLVKEGRLAPQQIDRAVSAILEAKFRLGLFENPFVDETMQREMVFSSRNQELSLIAARRSIVLLRNDDGFLPLNKAIRKLLVTGPNADNQTILGDWSLHQPEDRVITVFEGVRQEAPAGTIVDLFVTGTVKCIEDSILDAAVLRAATYDAVVVAVGENSLRYQQKEKTSGENIDRDNIELIGQQAELVRRLSLLGKPIIVVLINSRPLAVGEVASKAKAVLEAWEPGSMGGQAIGEIIFGKTNPSGKLAMSIPRSTGQIPVYYNHKPSNYFHKYIETKSSALYDFGFGLSYSKFDVTDLKLSSNEIKLGGKAELTCMVTNSGGMDGEEVVQLYIRDDVSSITRPVRELKGFQRVKLLKGGSSMIHWEIGPKELEMLDSEFRTIVEPGTFTIMVGTSSNDRDLQKLKLTVK